MATTTDRQSLVKPEHYVYSHITKIPGVCGGYATIDGHRIRVINVVYMHNWGYMPERMLEEYDFLNLAQIYAALSYYYENREELDKEIQGYKDYFERSEREWKERRGQRSGERLSDKPARDETPTSKSDQR